jgi:hypothetical protein
MAPECAIPQIGSFTTCVAVCSPSLETASSQSTDLRSSSSSLESTPRIGIEAPFTNAEKKCSWADCESDSEDESCADEHQLDHGEDCASVPSKSARRRQRRKRAGRIDALAASVLDASPQSAARHGHVKIDSVTVSAKSHHCTVVTVCDLGLDVISTPSLPPRYHSVAAALSQSCHTFHDAASLPVQQHLAQSYGMHQISSEGWVAVAMPICLSATEPRMMPVDEANARVAVGNPR